MRTKLAHPDKLGKDKKYHLKIQRHASKNHFYRSTFLQRVGSILKGNEGRKSCHFQNVGNVVTNGRQAIKRYNKKIKTGKLEPRKFETKTYSDENIFTITRIS